MIPNIKRTSKGVHGSTYAELDNVIDHVKKHLPEMVTYHEDTHCEYVDGHYTVGSKISIQYQHAETEEMDEHVSKFFIPVESTNPMDVGSALTYARRYNYMTAFGFFQEGMDDDGQNSSAPRKSYNNNVPDNPADFVFKFGKFKGKGFADIDKQDLTGYMVWLKGQNDPKNDKLVALMMKYLEGK